MQRKIWQRQEERGTILVRVLPTPTPPGHVWQGSVPARVPTLSSCAGDQALSVGTLGTGAEAAGATTGGLEQARG